MAAAVAGLVCISTAIWWIGKDESPALRESPVVSQNAVTSVDEKIVTPLSLPDERDAPRVERAGVDASTFYKDAFALYDRLSAEDRKLLHAPIQDADVEKAVALFEKIQPIMELLRRGAATDYCEWGVDPFGPQPQISKSSDLAPLALWNASFRLPKEADGAIDDLISSARLTHHIAHSAIGKVMEIGWDGMARDLVKRNVSIFDEAGRAKVRSFLSASALDRDVELFMAHEKEINRDFYERLSKLTPDERIESVQSAMISNPDDVGAAIFRDPDRFKAEMEFVQKAQAQMAEAMFWPDARFNEWMQQFDEKHADEHPLAVLLMPAYAGIRTSLQSARITREMLSVALDVLESGPDQAGRSRDPVTGRPFGYLPKPGGFELQSAFQSKGKPVTMRFDSLK